MSGVACATPVTPSLPSARLSARLPVGEWLPRAKGTSRQETLWYGSAQDTPLAGRHRKTGCYPRKISIRDPRNILEFTDPVGRDQRGKGVNRGCFGLVCIFFRNGITVWCVVGLIYGLGGACDKNFGLKRCLEAPGKQFHRFRGQKPNVNCDKINPMCNG